MLQQSLMMKRFTSEESKARENESEFIDPEELDDTTTFDERQSCPNANRIVHSRTSNQTFGFPNNSCNVSNVNEIGPVAGLSKVR